MTRFLLKETIGSLDGRYRMQYVPITTTIVSSNAVNGEVYPIEHYTIKFVSDLRKVSGFLQVLRITPPIKLKYC